MQHQNFNINLQIISKPYLNWTQKVTYYLGRLYTLCYASLADLISRILKLPANLYLQHIRRNNLLL